MPRQFEEDKAAVPISARLLPQDSLIFSAEGHGGN
jgi:hypothetical protein